MSDEDILKEVSTKLMGRILFPEKVKANREFLTKLESQIMKNKVYLAGGMSGTWQADVIRESGKAEFEWINPQHHNLEKSEEFTLWDLHFVKKCDILFAYISPDNPSGYGAAVEIGYAHALGKTIILVDERSPIDENFKKKYEIVHQTAGISFNTLSDGTKLLKRFADSVTRII